MLSGSLTGSTTCNACCSRVLPGEECAYCRDHPPGGRPLGDVLGAGTILARKFRIGRLLGRGGFGATYLAWDVNLEVRIAIKEFLPRQLVSRAPGQSAVHPYPGSEAAFGSALQQFLGEARNLAQFRDEPRIIAVLDFFPENGTGYMVMEYLDGCTVEQYAASVGRLELGVALRLLIPVADALRVCHGVGLIHRDISPDNIFLTGDHRVKLLDFGAARIAVGQRSTDLSVVLKEGYAPFEQYQRNGRQGAWTDIYALTATLYRLLTGELPPNAPDRVGGAPLPRLAERGVVGPARLQALLDKGMAVQAAHRHQSVDAFLDDLQALLKETPQGRIPRRKALAIGALAAAAAAIAGVVAVSRRGGETGTHPQPVAPSAQAGETPPPRQQREELADRGANQASAPAARNGASLDTLREFVREGAETQRDLRQVLAKAARATAALRQLNGVSSKSEQIVAAIRREETVLGGLRDDRDTKLGKYMSRVEWLSGQDATSVDAAIQLEGGSDGDPVFDLLARHIRMQRDRPLGRDAVLASLNA